MLEYFITLSYYSSKQIIKKHQKCLKSKEELLEIAKKLWSKHKNQQDVLQEKDFILENNINLITYHDDLYPSSLRQISDPPLILYIWGNESLLKESKVAIVGSRDPSMNNIYYSQQLSEFLSSRNLVVVSGLAKGIDAQAHKYALPHTIAILGTGFNKIYPAENRQLFHDIKEHGLLVSEYPVNTLPLKYNFPKRNRIISALSEVVVIIEAKRTSGSLITARMALEYNKEIFAVPGHPLDVRTYGCNQLIKDGANMLTDFEEILESLKLEPVNILSSKQEIVHSKEEGLDKTEREILKLLSDIPVDAEKISEELETDSAEICRALASLELADKIYKNSFGQVARKYII